VSVRFLLDTNALSEPLRRDPHRGFMRRLRVHTGRIAIASTTWHEALFGLHRMPSGERRQQVQDYLFDVVAPSIPILSYDEVAAEWHARERARLISQGQNPPFADGQIAAVAKVHDLALITANVRDFQVFEGIAIENWQKQA
jgi:tRNA(fMet)-specific endonuclease VapC